MSHPRPHRLAALLVPFALAALPAFAGVAPAGDEVAVGDSNRQRNPAAVFLGDHVLVAWEQDEGILFQRLDAGGVPAADAAVVVASDDVPPVPFRLRLDEQHQPALAAGEGGFALVWVEQTVLRRADIFYEKSDLITSRIMARLFDADANPVGPARRVAGGAVDVSHPAVIAAGDGYWVAWQQVGGEHPGVRIRRLSAEGAPGAGHFVAADGRRPSLASNGNRLLVAWEQCCGGRGVKREIHARMVDGEGDLDGGSFVVATGAIESEQPHVASGADGEFLVTWQRSPDGRHAQIYGQLLSGQGAFIGRQLKLSREEGDQGSPRAVSLPGGDYLVTYTQWYGTQPTGVTGAAFDGNGNALGQSFAVNTTYGVPGPYARAVTVGAEGEIFAVWDGRAPTKHRRLRGRFLELTD